MNSSMNKILLKTSLASGAMAGFQLGIRNVPMNKNLLIILGITALGNATAETIGELVFKGQSHQSRNMILEPLLASALMFGAFTLVGFTDLSNIKQAAISIALGFGLNLGSDILGNYITQ